MSELGKYRLDEIGDGKWKMFDATTLKQPEEVRKLILIKKKPDRKPFPKENALYSKCGQRCDLCVHYVGTTDEQREIMIPYLEKCGTTPIGA